MVLGGLAAGVVTAQDTISTSVTVPEMRLDELDELSRDNPDEFAGSTPDKRNGLVTIYVVRGGLPGAKKKISDKASKLTAGAGAADRTLRIQIVEVTHTWRELNSLHQSVTDHHDAIARALGTQLNEWFINPATNTVELGVSTLEFTRRGFHPTNRQRQ
jgi:hypothetical protein